MRTTVMCRVNNVMCSMCMCCCNDNNIQCLLADGKLQCNFAILCGRMRQLFSRE